MTPIVFPNLTSYDLVSFEYQNRETVLTFIGQEPGEEVLPKKTLYLFNTVISSASIVIEECVPNVTLLKFDYLNSGRRPFSLEISFKGNYGLIFKFQDYKIIEDQIPFRDLDQ